MTARRIVRRIEDGVDRQGVEATTYQMRNIYRQLGDGFFSVLDVMNYIQHHQVVRLTRSGDHLLDLCCGRGLLLPLLRYQKSHLGSYTGVDIEPRNAVFLHQRVTDGKPLPDDYYPFPVSFVPGNVGEIDALVPHVSFDLVVYTSSLEHMHPDMGRASLFGAFAVTKPGGTLFLTCPNTPEDRDGYDTQYRAHVYEWKRSEVLAALRDAGWTLQAEYGLLIDRATLETQAKRLGIAGSLAHIARHIPSEWYLPVLATLLPAHSKEIAYIATRGG